MYRINKLLKQNQKLFHTSDLALLWNITNKNTLYTTIKRYIKKGILIPVHKGFYSTVLLDQIDPIRLAIGSLHRYCYISCESILIDKNVIFQKSNYTTLISDINRKFQINHHSFLVRKMAYKFLYNPIEISQNNQILIASLERAVADLLYYNKNYYFDNQKPINWQKVKKIQKEVGY